ncbi:hypothetical protein NIES4106_56710 (plasmid) [Fischerella sp. NIES-4106]|nr:hypothetical protein NIES4106_56710 [Fischerella sp. NIES-4106]
MQKEQRGEIDLRYLDETGFDKRRPIFFYHNLFNLIHTNGFGALVAPSGYHLILRN